MSAPIAPSPEIADLVRRAQRGETGAFQDLVREFLPQVRRFARAFARDAADADDLAQEALIKAYRSLGGYRLESTFATWLYTIVRHAYLDAVKSRGAREMARAMPLSAQPAQVDPAPAADAALEQAQAHAHLWAAIGQVPADFRTVLVLFDIEGLTHEEVAAVEGVPVGTVKSRLFRGRAALRDLLRRAEGAGNPDGAPVVTPKAEGAK